MEAVGAVKSIYKFATAKTMPIATLGAAVTSSIFMVRNIKKVEDGHIGRFGVALGQGKNIYDYVVNKVNDIDNAIERASKTATKLDDKACGAVKKFATIVDEGAKTDKLIAGAGKAANWASEHVRPLIIASAGIDIALADNKKEATVENVCALSTMFCAEELIKSGAIQKKAKEIASSEVVQQSGFVKNVLPKIKNKISELTKNSEFLSKVVKHAPVVGAILGSIAFVLASNKAYDAGLAFADNVILKKDKDSQEYLA